MSDEVSQSCIRREGVGIEREEETVEALAETQEGTFTVVQGRKGRRKPRKKVDDFNEDIGDCKLTEREVTEASEDVLRKINNCANRLRSAEYYSTFLEKVTLEFADVEGSGFQNLNVFCLGLGAFTSNLLSRISRYQLALLVLLKEDLNASVEVFDPVFSDQEKHILSVELGFTVSEVNEEGRRAVETQTLIYMPHCPHQLVNNLLYANWKPESLQKCFIVCNSLRQAVSTLPKKYLDKNLSYLQKVYTICKEIPLPNTFTDHLDVFNDLSLHVFPVINFLNLPENFWLDKPCPIYTEQDFIVNESVRLCPIVRN